MHIFAHPKAMLSGNNRLYLRVTIDRQKKEFNLQQQWPIAYFDKVKEQVSKRFPHDMEADQVNMVINDAKAIANRIKLRYHVDKKMRTLPLFAKEFENYESRDNFLHYWVQKQQQQLAEGLISDASNMSLRGH